MKKSEKNVLVPLTTVSALDNVAVFDVSEKIREEKLSLLLFDCHLRKNLWHYLRRNLNSESCLNCHIQTSEGRVYDYFKISTGNDPEMFFYGGGMSLNGPGISSSMDPDLRKESLYSLLQPHTDYKGLNKTEYFFGIKNASPFSSYKVSSFHLSCKPFSKAPLLEVQDADLPIEEIQQRSLAPLYLQSYPNRGGSTNIPEAESCRKGWLMQVFEFPNGAGLVFLKVVKLYFMLTDHTLGKCYLPVSLWSFQPSRSSSLLTIGLPDKQPLFHLPELLKASTAVLCSSLEEASELQKKTKDEDVAFTAFVPGIGLYEYMDLAPLQGKEVKLLISNHSGMSLAEAYLEAWKLSEYLQTKAGIGEITYLQREIEYPDMVQVFELEKLLSLHRNQPLRVVEDSILELNEAGFQEMVIKAQMEIQRKEKESKNMAFWQQKKVEETPSLPATSSPRSLTDLMILRPYLVRGTTTVIVSEPGMGKSCFTTAICARVAGSNAPFIEERCWTRCTPKGKNYKVAYLVFDSDGDAAIADHRKDFASDLGENEDNFIVRNMAGGEINYAEEANYNAFLNLLRDIEMEQGEKGKGIDLLVIDTILAFTGSKTGKAYSIFNKLQKDFPNMAILAVHHLNKENETYGGILTTMGPRTIIKLSRTEEQKKTLNGRRPTLKDPFTLAIEKSNNNKIPEDGEAFELYLDDKNHFVVSSPKYTLQEMRKLLKEYYKDLGQRATGRLFGVGDRTIRNW